MQDEEQIKKEFEQLMVRHGKIVEFLCRRASYGREVICQELVQECYVALLRHLMERRVEGMEKGERAWVSMQCRSAILHNFPVNDTLAVDVTLLQATDSAGWERLKRDYGVREMPDIVMKKIEKGEDVVSVRYVSKSNPTLPADTVDMSNNNILAVSRLHRAVSVFHTETEAEQAAVNYNQLEIGLKTH